MKALFTLILMLFALFAVRAEAPPDIGDKEKASIETKVYSTTVASPKHLQIVAIQAESAELPAVFRFAWSDRLTCGLERLGEFNATTEGHKAIPAKRPRDWLSKV